MGKNQKKPAPSRAVSVTRSGRSTSRRAGIKEITSLLRMQEDRQRIMARQLHDTVGQNMAALQMNLFLIRDSDVKIHPRFRPALANSLLLAQTCVQEIRSLSYSLYPPLLDELGLLAALRAYAVDYSQRTGLDVSLNLPARMSRLEQRFEITLFRIAQDSLERVGGESQGPVALRIRKRAASVVFELSIPEICEQDEGILRIEARARLIGSSLTIENKPQGTTLRVILPAEAQYSRTAQQS